MEIKLELKKHCIQTEAKKKYEKLMGEYFKKAASGRNLSILENQIEALVYFLEHADFQYLRSTYTFLNGNQGGEEAVLHIPDALEDMKLIHDNKVIDII
jgi:hypothetical protein